MISNRVPGRWPTGLRVAAALVLLAAGGGTLEGCKTCAPGEILVSMMCLHHGCPPGTGPVEGEFGGPDVPTKIDCYECTNGQQYSEDLHCCVSVRSGEAGQECERPRGQQRLGVQGRAPNEPPCSMM